MFNLPSFIFALLAYQSTAMLSTETIGIGVALMGAVVFQQFLNLMRDNAQARGPVASCAPQYVERPSRRKLKLDRFSDRPAITWKGNARDPLNPLDF